VEVVAADQASPPVSNGGYAGGNGAHCAHPNTVGNFLFWGGLSGGQSRRPARDQRHRSAESARAPALGGVGPRQAWLSRVRREVSRNGQRRYMTAPQLAMRRRGPAGDLPVLSMPTLPFWWVQDGSRVGPGFKTPNLGGPYCEVVVLEGRGVFWSSHLARSAHTQRRNWLNLAATTRGNL
jgi:hypothetical protein